MKKIFAIAIVSLMVAFISSAEASDNDNAEVVFVIGDVNSQVDALAFDSVAVATEFAFNVTGEVVNYAEGDNVSIAVDTVGILTNNSFANAPIDYGIQPSEYGLTTNGIYSNEYELIEPNLIEPVNTFTSTNGIYSNEYGLTNKHLTSTETAFVDAPIDYSIRSNEYGLTDNSTDNLTEYVSNKKEFAYADTEFTRDIATNIGKS